MRRKQKRERVGMASSEAGLSRICGLGDVFWTIGRRGAC